MTYLEFVNSVIRKEIADKDNLVVFGQNINAGSCLGGLTKNMAVRGKNSRIINSINAENSLAGFGFGLMMTGGRAIFFMKQLDFLLLGLDHLVNTYNIVRSHVKYYPGSFTIFPIVVDKGYEGPQSSLNNFADFCSMARIKGFAITNKADAEKIIPAELAAPGFRIIAVSQRLFKEELIAQEKIVYESPDLGFFQYAEGAAATIASFNFSFPQGWALRGELQKHGINASLFNVNSPTPANWERIISDASKTGKLVVIDDSKSANLACYKLASDFQKAKPGGKTIVIARELEADWLSPVSDKLELDYGSIAKELEHD